MSISIKKLLEEQKISADEAVCPYVLDAIEDKAKIADLVKQVNAEGITTAFGKKYSQSSMTNAMVRLGLYRKWREARWGDGDEWLE